MVVSKNIYGDWVTLSGTLAEVGDALDDEKVPEHKVKGMASNTDSTVICVIYHK